MVATVLVARLRSYVNISPYTSAAGNNIKILFSLLLYHSRKHLSRGFSKLFLEFEKNLPPPARTAFRQTEPREKIPLYILLYIIYRIVLLLLLRLFLK